MTIGSKPGVLEGDLTEELDVLASRIGSTGISFDPVATLNFDRIEG